MPSQQYLALEQRLKVHDQLAPAEMLALARSGDADALFKASELSLRGMTGKIDLKAAYKFMSEAAAKGQAEAKRAQAYYLAAGIGTKADPIRARKLLSKIAESDRFVAVQLAFLNHLGCAERVKSAKREIVSEDPHIEVVQGLFSPEECRYIQLLANPWMEPAMIYSTAGAVRDPHRDSDNMVVTPMAEDLVIQAINRCIAEATRTKVQWGEPLHVIRYRPGQQYRPHHDANTFAAAEDRRIATAIIYLNGAYEGGETHFPKLGLRVRGAVGDMLVFHNLKPDKEMEPRAMHAGLPILSGEKWIATRWIRGRNYFGRG